MDGICEVVPVADRDVTLTIGDDVFILGMLTVEDWSAITNEVRKLRPDPIAVALRFVAGLESREEKALILEKAWTEARRSQIVPESEVLYWGTTPEGATYCLWLSLLHHHPRLTLEVVRSWVHPQADPGVGLGIEAICQLVQRVHALPPSGPT
jgi:hypothetical protein